MNRYWLNIGRRLAIDTIPFGNAKVSAILVYKDAVSYGDNFNPKSHPLAKKYGKNPLAIFPHAELKCIINAERRGFTDWNKSTLYVVRVYKNGEFALAKPCDGCFRAIVDYDIGKVVFSISEGKYGIIRNY